MVELRRGSRLDCVALGPDVRLNFLQICALIVLLLFACAMYLLFKSNG